MSDWTDTLTRRHEGEREGFVDPNVPDEVRDLEPTPDTPPADQEVTREPDARGTNTPRDATPVPSPGAPKAAKKTSSRKASAAKKSR